MSLEDNNLHIEQFIEFLVAQKNLSKNIINIKAILFFFSGRGNVQFKPKFKF